MTEDFEEVNQSKVTFSDGNATIVLQNMKFDLGDDEEEGNAMLDSSEIKEELKEVKTLDYQVEVKFHQYQTFVNSFASHFEEPEVVMKSLLPRYNVENLLKSGEGAGKSGSFFFFSHDHKFIVKTMVIDELKLYLKLLPQFTEHFKENPRSLLARIFGVFTLKM